MYQRRTISKAATAIILEHLQRTGRPQTAQEIGDALYESNIGWTKGLMTPTLRREARIWAQEHLQSLNHRINSNGDRKVRRVHAEGQKEKWAA